MRIKADLYSGRLFEYWEPKALPLDATGHQPSQYEDKHRDRSKHETQSYNDDERRHRDQNETFANKPYWPQQLHRFADSSRLNLWRRYRLSCNPKALELAKRQRQRVDA